MYVASKVSVQRVLCAGGMYTERVMDAVHLLRDKVMPNFAQRVEFAVEALNANPPRETDENDFIDASRLVYDGVRDIRRAVLMNKEHM